MPVHGASAPAGTTRHHRVPLGFAWPKSHAGPVPHPTSQCIRWTVGSHRRSGGVAARGPFLRRPSGPASTVGVRGRSRVGFLLPPTTDLTGPPSPFTRGATPSGVRPRGPCRQVRRSRSSPERIATRPVRDLHEARKSRFSVEARRPPHPPSAGPLAGRKQRAPVSPLM